MAGTPYAYAYQFRDHEGADIDVVFSRVPIIAFQREPDNIHLLYKYPSPDDVVPREDYEAMVNRVNELQTLLRDEKQKREAMAQTYAQIKRVTDQFAARELPFST